MSAEDKERGDARDRVRADLARAAKFSQDVQQGKDMSDIPPHLWGRA